MSLIQAARAALEAIESADEIDTDMRAASDALRAAMAEAEKAEPVAWLYHYRKIGGGDRYQQAEVDVGPCLPPDARDGWEYVKKEPLYRQPPAAAQPVAVPAGWRLVPEQATPEMVQAAITGWTHSAAWRSRDDAGDRAWRAALAAAPAAPARPLTDAELRQIAYATDAAGGSVIEYGRAIERAVRGEA